MCWLILSYVLCLELRPVSLKSSIVVCYNIIKHTYLLCIRRRWWLCTFSALMLSVGRQEWHLACKKLSGGVLAWLSVWSEMQTCILPSWCHCHSLSLTSVKSRLVLPFWYHLTQVVSLSWTTWVQTCIQPSWCHCHSLSLASVKSRLVVPFWYQLTRVVLDKRPLKVCVCVRVRVRVRARVCVCVKHYAWKSKSLMS